jgi:4-hydroxy-3-polyprenylbenzoate decarboxylase
VSEVVDWQYELGRRTRAAGRPVLFENIIDYPGQRVFCNGLWSPGAIRLALGFDADLPEDVFLDEVRKRIAHPIAPQVVEAGPVLENVVEGDALNLFELPIPQWHEQDAGRYLGTWHLNVTRDPETGARNLGVYRMQMLGSRHATVSGSSRSHLGRQMARAESAGEPLPMTVVIGAAEPLVMAAAAAYPEGMDEYELAGALMQRPVELVRPRPGSLAIPADAEIAIEGVIQPGVRARDGAYVDYTGRADTNTHAFLFEAERLLYRNRAIFRGASIGLPGAEDHQVFAFLASLNLVDFHGSRSRRFLQNLLLRKRYFSLLQRVDRINRDALRQFLHGTGSR